MEVVTTVDPKFAGSEQYDSRLKNHVEILNTIKAANDLFEYLRDLWRI